MYPFSILKTVQVKGIEKKEILNSFKEELKKIEVVKYDITQNVINLKECEVFSSKGTHRIFKELNFGNIRIDDNKDNFKIKGEIFLVEHLIFLTLLIVIGLVLSYNSQIFTAQWIGLFLILYLAVFVYFYLIPLMSFYTFIEGVIKNVTDVKA